MAEETKSLLFGSQVSLQRRLAALCVSSPHLPVSEENMDGASAPAWHLKLSNRPAIAGLKMTAVSTRTGSKKPTYELAALLPSEGPSHRDVKDAAARETPSGEGAATAESPPTDHRYDS